MSAQIRRLTQLSLLCAVLLALGAGSSDSAGETRQAAFSRSRWIEEMEKVTLFSGEVVPLERFPAAVLTAPAVAPQKKKGTPWVRVSRDILAPDPASQGQPETQTEPFLAIDPAREASLLAGYQENRFADGGARALTFAVSKNAGRTWKEGLVPGLTQLTGGQFQRASDPWVAFGPAGSAYYASLLFNETNPDNGVFVSASTTSGKSWGPPVEVHRGSIDEFDDKQAVVVDTAAGSPFRGRVYVGWDTVLNSGNEVLRVSWSGDGGHTYTPSAVLHDRGANLGIIPMIGPDGTVYAVWFHADGVRGPFSILSSRSEDGGDTWSAPALVAEVDGSGVRSLRTGGLPAAAIDPLSGRLYAVWPDGSLAQGIDQILLVQSDDGGRTWSAPQVVSDGPADAPSFTPAVAVGPTGLLAVSYYSLRNDPVRRFLVDHYIATSKNGTDFAAARRTTTSSYDARFAAVTEGGFFLGDYQGLVAGRKVVQALWIGTLEPSKIDPPARQPDAFVLTIKP